MQPVLKFQTHWKKKGLLLGSADRAPWMGQHTQMPIVDRIDGQGDSNRVRVYFSTRDSSNRSLPASFEVDLAEPTRILEVSRAPLLDLGLPGSFDDQGVMPSCVVDFQGKKYLYYIGWNIPNNVPFRNAIGLAVSEDGGKSFKKMFDGPVLDRGPEDPYYCATPFVRIENGLWRMWYMAGLPWARDGEKWRSRYNVRYAESDDGIHWRRHTKPHLELNSGECAIARPMVVRAAGIYRMWFCYRWDRYRIGYAESADGLLWTRDDSVSTIAPTDSIAASATWDDEMVCYPFVLEGRNAEEKDVLFYNGNRFGQTGIGYAISEP